MGWHFSKVRGHGHIGPLKQKSQGAQAPGTPVPTPMLLMLCEFVNYAVTIAMRQNEF